MCVYIFIVTVMPLLNKTAAVFAVALLFLNRHKGYLLAHTGKRDREKKRLVGGGLLYNRH